MRRGRWPGTSSGRAPSGFSLSLLLAMAWCSTCCTAAAWKKPRPSLTAASTPTSVSPLFLHHFMFSPIEVNVAHKPAVPPHFKPSLFGPTPCLCPPLFVAHPPVTIRCTCKTAATATELGQQKKGVVEGHFGTWPACSSWVHQGP